MNASARRDRLRAALAGQHCLYPASVFDPLSARIAEDLGFELAMLAGSIASLAVLGAPDLIVLTLTELAEQVRRICRAADVPLLVDADHGYGNALNVKRTVEELEAAGVSALSIEDTVLPTPFASTAPALVSIEEGVGKMKAALAGRQDPRLVIVGRTSAAAMTSLEDAIARAKAYEAVGVDALFFVGLRQRAQLDAIAAAVHLPIVLGGATAELSDREYLASRRVRVALQGHLPFQAAARAVYDTLKALRDGTPPAKIKGAASAELMQQLARETEYRRWTREFLASR